MESEKLQESQNEEFAQAIHKSFECQRTDLIVSRTNLESEFSTSVSEIENSIAQLRANGLNPESIKGDQGEDINLIAIRDELLLKRKKLLSKSMQPSKNEYGRKMQSVCWQRKQKHNGVSLKQFHTVNRSDFSEWFLFYKIGYHRQD